MEFEPLVRAIASEVGRTPSLIQSLRGLRGLAVRGACFHVAKTLGMWALR